MHSVSRKQFFILLLFLINRLLTAQPCLAERSSTKVGDTTSTQIGAVLPMTGDYAQYGKELWRGLELAAAHLSDTGQGFNLRLEDGSTMQVAAGLNAATKLVKIDGVEVLVVLGADDVGPLVGLSRQAGIPILSLWDNSQELRNFGDLVFSSGFSVEATGEHVAHFATSTLRFKNAAIINNQSTWSYAVSAAFRTTLQKRGGHVVFDKTIDDTSTDFRTLAAQLRKASPDFVYLPLSLPGTVSGGIRQLRQGGVTAPIITGEALVGDAVEQLGDLAEGIYVAWLPAPDPELRAAYRKRYNTDSWDLAIVQVGYRGLMDISAARQKTQSASMHQALLNYFGPSRSADSKLALYQIRNTRLVAAE
jgi:branched-chain amino acid transport system substrate-binding protein